MTKIEWVLLIIIVFFIDIAQAIASALALGIIANRFVNIVIGVLLPYYLHMKGIDMIDFKKIMFMFVAFGGEVFVVGDFLPLWTIALILTYITVKGEEDPESKLGKVSKVLRTVNKAANIRKPLNKDRVRLPNKS